MYRRTKPTALFGILLSLALVSLACSSITISLNDESPTENVGFDFADRTPSSPAGDTAAGEHLFLHKYPFPSDGYITGIAYLNDSDSTSESFDLLILRPNQDGWDVLYRITLSDDTPPAETGITLVDLPYPLPVQEGDIFAHWQYDAGGAIPANIEHPVDGSSAGQHGFGSSAVEIGQKITKYGFSGQRDYFINVIFTTNP